MLKHSATISQSSLPSAAIILGELGPFATGFIPKEMSPRTLPAYISWKMWPQLKFSPGPILGRLW